MKDKKLVSYCLLTFNQEDFISDAVNAALSQTYSPLEIIISDDCSSDRTFDIIESLVSNYDGPHQIILNRNQSNMGIGGHFSKVCYEIASGECLITAAGDDISKIDHVSKAFNHLSNNKGVCMVDFTADIINSKGEIIEQRNLDREIIYNSLEDFLKLKRMELFAPGRIIKRDLLRNFNEISLKCPTEDSVLVFRSLMMGGFIRVNDSLVYYRKHAHNVSGSKGLAKLSNYAIISQYLDDLTQAYNNGLLDEKNAVKFYRRIIFEYSKRCLLFAPRSNKLQYIFRRIKFQFLKMKYRIFY